jgi:hypothetical protein
MRERRDSVIGRGLAGLLGVLLLLAWFGGSAGAAEAVPASLVVSVEERPSIFGKRSPTTGEYIIPGIEIYADGTTIIKSSDGEATAKRIDLKRVQELLAFFGEQKLFEISQTKIFEDMKKAGVSAAPPTDQTTSVIFAANGPQKVAIIQSALPYFVEKYPQVGSVQALERCIAKTYEIAGEKRY